MSRLIYQGRYEDNGFETKEKWKGCKTSLILGREGGEVGLGEIEGEVPTWKIREKTFITILLLHHPFSHC